MSLLSPLDYDTLESKEHVPYSLCILHLRHYLMVGNTEDSLIQFMWLITMWQNIPLPLVPVEYMLSREHVCGFSVLGISETFQSN